MCSSCSVPFRHTLRKQEVALCEWSGSKNHDKVSVGDPAEGSRSQLQKESPKSPIGLFESRFKINNHVIKFEDIITHLEARN